MTNQNLKLLSGVLFVALVSISLGKMVAGVSLELTAIITGAVFICVISFMGTDFLMCLLILSMLLSPEIVIGRVPGRDIALRLEDLIIVLLFIAWLFKLITARGEGRIQRTPIGRPILFYCGKPYTK